MTPREKLREGIRELWIARKSKTRLEQKQVLKKIKLAVEQEEKAMLRKITQEELGGDDMETLAEDLETAEVLAAGEEPITEAPAGEEAGAGEEAAGEEPPKKKRSYTRRNPAISETIQPKKGAKSRQKVTPNDDGGGHPLALGNGHTNGNGHSGNGNGGLVTLSPGQLSKLWGIVTGGELGIGIEADGGVTCWVSESSFKKALPALIDRL